MVILTNIYIKYEKKEKKVEKVIVLIEKVIVFALTLLILYLYMLYSNKENSNIVIRSFILIIGLYLLLCNFVPLNIFKLFTSIFEKINDIIFVKIHSYFINKAKNEIKEIFNS